MIPLATPDLNGNEARYLDECVRSTFVSSVGPFVDRFEGMVAQASGAAGAVATSAGTTALHLALTALGVGRDDLVIVPSLTFIASANAVAHCGAMPWLLDVEPAAWTLDAALLERVLERETAARNGQLFHRTSGNRVAAVMPVHVLGHPADMDAIVAVAQHYGLPVVADAAAALGATCRGRRIADTGANLSVFSFNGNKTVTAGGGGAVAGADPDLLRLARHLSTTARIGDAYDHDRIGFNYRLTNLQAAVGCAQLERLEVLLTAKRRIRCRYAEAFSGVRGLTPFPKPPWGDGACWMSGVVLGDGLVEHAAALRAGLRHRGVDARPFWKPIHLQEPYRTAPRTAMPVSDGVWRRILTLPSSSHLDKADQAHVIAVVCDVLGSAKEGS